MTTTTNGSDFLGHGPNLTFATNGYGTPVQFDPAAADHLIVAGAAGTGKTHALRALALSALQQGWAVSAIDTIRRGADYKDISRYFHLGVAADYEAALDLLARVYDECSRRRRLVVEHGAADFDDLPEDVRPARRLVIVEETFSLICADAVPPKTDDAEFDAEHRQPIIEANTLKARIAALLTNLVLVGPASGVSLVLESQRFNAEDLRTLHVEPRGSRVARLLMGRSTPLQRLSFLADPDGAPALDHPDRGQGIFETPGQPTEVVKAVLVPFSAS